jgi:hypothetical protein
MWDNINIQELFHKKVQDNLKIDNGTVSFHFNRKLCNDKIATFLKDVKLTNSVKRMDYNKDTNGDQMSCIMTQLTLEVTMVTPHVAFLQWNNFKISDTRQLLSYVLSYKET